VEGVEHLLSESGVKLHLYGKKTVRNKRKIGHITVLDSTIEKALVKAERVRNEIHIVPEPRSAAGESGGSI
jgi:5-(carboxyamino)imidazole ribonucleotide synthase